jgi:hypothetical protein
MHWAKVINEVAGARDCLPGPGPLRRMSCADFLRTGTREGSGLCGKDF